MRDEHGINMDRFRRMFHPNGEGHEPATPGSFRDFVALWVTEDLTDFWYAFSVLSWIGFLVREVILAHG